MAVVRELDNSDTYITYLSTLALFCGISCTIVMIKFKGFRASLDLSTGKTHGKHYELAPQVSVVGAYRTNREEYFGNINYLDARKTITPSMVKLPPSTHTTQTTQTGNKNLSKSVGDLTTAQNVPAEVRTSTPNVSVHAPPGSKEAKSQLKAQKKLEKERMIEQKKKEKLAAQEREKEEKIRKEREKQAAQQQAKEAKENEKLKKKKCIAPRPQQQTTVQQDTQNPVNPPRVQKAPQKREAPPPPHFQKVTQHLHPNANPLSQRPVQDSRNSLESSISRYSGPPPYTDSPEIVPNTGDNTENTTFVKPTESSSWDLVSQHRQQMNRSTATNLPNSKQRNIDMRYNVGNLTINDKDNSEV